MNIYDMFSQKKSDILENITPANAIETQIIDENLRKWFDEKWVRFGPDGKIRGDCARGDDSEGKPKCLPQSKAHDLGKKGRASAASRKRREDPNPERSGAAINVATKKKTNEQSTFKPTSIYDTQQKEWEEKIKDLPRGNQEPLSPPSTLSRIMSGEKISDIFMSQQDKEDKAKRIQSYNNPTVTPKTQPAASTTPSPTRSSSTVSGNVTPAPNNTATAPSVDTRQTTTRSISGRVTPAPDTSTQSQNIPSSTDTSWQKIYNINKQTIGGNPNLIKVGQKLTLPNGKTYTVGKGDNLYNIAKGIYKGKLSEDFQFNPEQEKWLGGADRKNPHIISRMPGPKPPPEYFSNTDDQKIAQQTVRSQDLANKWQQFRQSDSLANKAINRIPGVNQVANVVDVGANLVKGDLSAAGRQAIGMIPAAKPLNLALQAGDALGNIERGDYASGGRGLLGIAAGQGSDTAGKMLKGLNTVDKVKKASNTLSNVIEEQAKANTCPHCGGPSFDSEILAEKKDACYHKVKSRYKVWPSAYASGALVKCRKKGAKNWGKSKANEDSNLYFNVIGTDKKTLINEFNLQHNKKGWYLSENATSSQKLDAIRAFGMPLNEEELNPTAYSGTAATIGVDNPRSPVGSVPKSQQINKKSKGKNNG